MTLCAQLPNFSWHTFNSMQFIALCLTAFPLDDCGGGEHHSIHLCSLLVPCTVRASQIVHLSKGGSLDSNHSFLLKASELLKDSGVSNLQNSTGGQGSAGTPKNCDQISGGTHICALFCPKFLKSSVYSVTQNTTKHLCLR